MLGCSVWKSREWLGVLSVLLRAIEASGHIEMSGFSEERVEEAEMLYNEFWNNLLLCANRHGKASEAH